MDSLKIRYEWYNSDESSPIIICSISSTNVNVIKAENDHFKSEVRRVLLQLK